MSNPNDAIDYRKAMGEFATGVTVVTYWANGEPRGTTVNSFTSVSLDPKLLLVSMDKQTRSLPHLRDGAFTINILPESAESIARHFAGRPQNINIGWSFEGASPRLSESNAWFSCVPWAVYDGGDHELVVGQVHQYAVSGGEPLLFYRGTMQPLSPVTV